MPDVMRVGRSFLGIPKKKTKELYFDDPNTDVLFYHFISLVAATKRTGKESL